MEETNVSIANSNVDKKLVNATTPQTSKPSIPTTSLIIIAFLVICVANLLDHE